jgi:hypothetical protein
MAAQNGFISRAGSQAHGDGNGVVEGGVCGSSATYYGWNIATGETALFWDDLTSAAMIDQAFSSPDTTCQAPNTTVPRAKISGNYLAIWSSCSSGFGCLGVGTPGINYLALISVNSTDTGGLPGLTVAQAYAVDQKMDDGSPMAGAIQAFFPYVPSSNIPSWAPNAATDSSATCFNSSTNAYSTSINRGAAMNCGLSLKFR